MILRWELHCLETCQVNVRSMVADSHLLRAMVGNGDKNWIARTHDVTNTYNSTTDRRASSIIIGVLLGLGRTFLGDQHAVE